MENLFSGFPSLSLQEWKRNLERDLKGINFDQLSFVDDSGLTIYPFYNQEISTKCSSPLSTRSGWNICSMVQQADDEAANRYALEELNSGAEGLLFVVEENSDPKVLLRNVSVPHIRLHFLFTGSPEQFTGKFRELCLQKKYIAQPLNGTFIFDPVAMIARGDLHAKSDLEKWAEFSRHALFRETQYTPLFADGFIYHNAGASAVSELACILAHLNEYLHLAEKHRLDLGKKEVVISSSCSTGFFESVSKFRALRQLVTFLLEQYGMRNPLFLHVANSLVNKTARDIHNNLIRSAIEGMAAVAGGADSIQLWPYDMVAGPSSAQARRWAINQQLIFKEESFLDKVADIPAGSYYIETRTREMADAAWKEFREIEHKGGLIACLEKNIIKEKIERQKEQAAADLREGKKVMVGINKFRNEKEIPPARTFLPGEKGLGFFIAETSLGEESIKKV